MVKPEVRQDTPVDPKCQMTSSDQLVESVKNEGNSGLAPSSCIVKPSAPYFFRYECSVRMNHVK